MQRPDGTRGLGLLDGTQLKLVAMASMVLDHLGDNFFPDQLWMRVIGRMALPIFAFCIAEGFSHTHDRWRYLARMGVFACVSEVPFDLVTAGKALELSHQNIMATFFWSILGLLCYERVMDGNVTSRMRRAAGVAVLLAFMAGSVLLRLDYNMLAIGLVFIFYLFRDKALPVRNAIAMGFHALMRNVGIYWFGLLGFLPIFLYDGTRGRGLKWLFYLFYPGHLLLIYLVRRVLGG